MRTLIPLALLLATLGCEPPKARPQVALPPPVVTEQEQAAVVEEPSVPGPPTAAEVAATAPAVAEDLDQRYRQVVTALEECRAAMSALETTSEGPEREKRLSELRESATSLAAEAKELRARAAELKDTGQRLRALGGG